MGVKETETRVATGVYVRISKTGKKSLRITFRYRYKYCREKLNFTVNTRNIKKAIRLRKELLKAIAFGDFNYTDFFPYSKNAIRFGHVPKATLVNELIDLYLERIKQRVSDNTYDRYQRTCNKHLRLAFGKLPVTELSAGIIWDWLNKFKCQRKTILNILTPLRYVVAEAMIRGYLTVNPFTLIDLKLLTRIKSTYEVNPFTQAEIYKLLATAEGQIKNLFQFAFYTGLRTAELVGLRWEDVDLENGFIYIRRIVVQGKVRPTKTKRSRRTVQLLRPALSALKAQKQYTLWQQSYIFFNPQKKRPWKDASEMRKQAWLPLFKITNIEYRNLYQTRHTFASMMVSGGEYFPWVSGQMGHETMLTTARYYTRWIPDQNIFGGYRPVNQW
ncbi:MAG: site-specific integrase [Gammaproteobacteria bacterium CG11_big_fil_rev_8_21_14_0_20_46_22]|nr:MAG: site-specific integrase [Gammaproteobacteria bacterium CG12_big_fil_rev_8_21_14_0_65_46_12]PIR11055.1 MAG: site-specific integrase [Gammaproteobacteria bacterium CG11_big_fil_rev_8_21_14_0_20_46_22]